MIGFYDYTVILTYLSLVSSICGLFFACGSGGHYNLAVLCLAFSGFCDMLDGKVARKKLNRSEDEKHFGIQIDSLSDMVCFIATPIVICYQIGLGKIALGLSSFVQIPTMVFGKMILCFYGIAGVIRLAYYNVMEEKRQDETDAARKYYSGMPVTSISVILPLIVLVRFLLGKAFVPILGAIMLITGFLFIINFKFRKPTNKELSVIVFMVAAAVAGIFLRKHIFIVLGVIVVALVAEILLMIFRKKIDKEEQQ